MDFQVRRDDLHAFRVVAGDTPEPGPGQALLEIDAFGLTTNNITYAVFGEAMSYWNFFPADAGWGRVPVWGFANVAATGDTELSGGSRVFGYFPPSSELVVVPERIDARGFVDASPHRASLPSAYNSYALVEGLPLYEERFEEQQMLLWPLFFTAFLIDDFLGGEELFGAGTALVSSASSKTALSAAFLLARREGVEVVGLTSPCQGGVRRGPRRLRPRRRLPGRPVVAGDARGLRGHRRRRRGPGRGPRPFRRRAATQRGSRCDSLGGGGGRERAIRFPGRSPSSSSLRTTCAAAAPTGDARSSTVE